MKKIHFVAYVVPCCALFLLSFFIKLPYITYRDICGDEPFSIFLAQASYTEIYHVQATGNNPPLWEWLLHIWVGFFGTKAAYVRMLPLLINACTAPVLFLLAQKFFGRWAAWATASLFIFSNLHFYFALETRVYSLFSLLTACALYVFLSIVNNDKKYAAWVIALFFVDCLLVYAHYFGWIVVGMQVVSTVFFYHKKILPILLSTAAIAAAYTPVWAAVYKNFAQSAKQGTWLSVPHKYQIITELEQFANHRYALILFVFIIIICGIMYIKQNQNTAIFTQKKHKIYAIALLWFVVPYVFMWAISFKMPIFLNRYILFCTVPLFVFLGGFCVDVWASNKKMQAVFALILVMIMAAFFERNPHLILNRQLLQATRSIQSTMKTTDAMVLIHPFWAELALGYHAVPQAFANYAQHEAAMHAAQLHPVWELTAAQHWLRTYPHKTVLYYQDGAPQDPQIKAHLQQHYTQSDSVYFRDGLQLITYTPRQN